MLKLKILLSIVLLLQSLHQGCRQNENVEKKHTSETAHRDSNSKDSIHTQAPIIVGAERTDYYLPLLKNKRVALLVNQTSKVRNESLVDFLLRQNILLQKVFAPEHGFRGTADAGAHIASGKDPQTGIPIISLYGKHKMPSHEDLEDVDILVFDIQDVGARFYTYISTMHYAMEACAKHGVDFMILDRPNPNGHYVNGNVLNRSHKSFVGMHPVPIVHGMTVGEYAHMINGEDWLADGKKVKLKVIPCLNYTHSRMYTLPVKPSPNLPNDRSIFLYPTLCLFEGTVVSIGRGTGKQFQVMGHPHFPDGNFSFTPTPMPGASKPKLQGKLCKGYDLSTQPVLPELIEQTQKLPLEWLIEFYQKLNMGEAFFSNPKFFDKLAGSSSLRQQIISGMSADEIRDTWQDDLQAFKIIRNKYLLYAE